MIAFGFSLTPQRDEIYCEPDLYGCGGKMQRVPGELDRGQSVYQCECGHRRTLPPDGGWICPSCGCRMDDDWGDKGECLDCYIENFTFTKPDLQEVYNPGCLGAKCPANAGTGPQEFPEGL